MTYVAIYSFYVPKARLEEFLEIQSEAMKIYREYGVIDSATYEVVDQTAKNMCASFDQGLKGLGTDEVAVIGIDQFKDRSDLNQIKERIDADERMTKLGDRLTGIIGPDVAARAFRGEFAAVE